MIDGSWNLPIAVTPFMSFDTGHSYMNKTITQKITPHLWFDNNAKEASQFYTSIFKDSKIKNVTTVHNTPSGTVEIFTVELLRNSRSSAQARSSNSTLPYHFLSSAP
jgi:hypothetical protein